MSDCCSPFDSSAKELLHAGRLVDIHQIGWPVLSINSAQNVSPHSHAHACLTQLQTYNMAFSFGFSGDDIEEDPNDVVPQTQSTSAPGADIPPPIAAKAHDLDELVCSQPTTSTTKTPETP
jgi:hypothetical protein